MTGARSSVQNWSEAMAAFQMPYSHAIGQYSSACMLILSKKMLGRCRGIKSMLGKIAVTDIYT